MEEILSKIGFDYRVALANLVNFLIVLWVLQKFAFPKIQIVLAERQAKIRKGLADAEAAKQAKLNELISTFDTPVQLFTLFASHPAPSF